MLYRCPYCGEPALTSLEKMGLNLTKAGFHIICPQCQRFPVRVMGRLGVWGHVLIASGVPFALLIASLLLFYTDKPTALFLTAVAVIALLWFFLNYFFCYFDKRTKLEREADARLQVAVPEGTTLWPYVKKGEIYKARLPKRGNNEADSVIVVMVADRRKGGLELRVIQAYGLPLPAVDEPLWLITHGDRVVEGTVTAVKPGHDVTPPPYYNGRE